MVSACVGSGILYDNSFYHSATKVPKILPRSYNLKRLTHYCFRILAKNFYKTRSKKKYFSISQPCALKDHPICAKAADVSFKLHQIALNVYFIPLSFAHPSPFSFEKYGAIFINSNMSIQNRNSLLTLELIDIVQKRKVERMRSLASKGVLRRNKFVAQMIKLDSEKMHMHIEITNYLDVNVDPSVHLFSSKLASMYALINSEKLDEYVNDWYALRKLS